MHLRIVWPDRVGDWVFDTGLLEAAETQCAGVAFTARNVASGVTAPTEFEGNTKLYATADNLGLSVANDWGEDSDVCFWLGTQLDDAFEGAEEFPSAVGIAA